MNGPALPPPLPSPLPPPGEVTAFGAYEMLRLHRPGARHLVVALTGLGDASRPYAGFEFQSSLQDLPEVDAVLLRDTSRSWWLNPEGWAELVAALRALAAARPYASISLLGLSLGARGALALAGELPQARVLALSPPYTLDRARHGRWVVRHARWLEAHAAGAGSDSRLVGDPARYLLAFGDDEPIDLASLALFEAAGWPGLFLLPGALHNLARVLKERRRLGRVIALLASGAPMPAVAAAMGALAAHPHVYGLRMLAARRLLFQGELRAADEALEEAWAVVGAQSPRLGRLLWLRHGLDPAPPPRAVLEALPCATLDMTLEGGASLSFRSSEAVRVPGPVLLGPLALLRLRLPGATRAVLTLRAEAPPRLNAGGATPLTAFRPEGAGWRPLAQSPAPQQPLRVELPLEEGEAELLLHRPGFFSGFDAEGTADQFAWAMRLRELALAPG
ncbi:hypothetical protein NON00_12020 [Roseomonas sp. GC11]|uniref:hypothetical protein n=1 Tax=Roseomonas sp. GC11 TaxID=2950546 RepID=UPI00210EEBA3|nr:hypothetical protein [Roseomonas sp. GC11]MCQ4160652.1 hypothetical protein [Roseomonas sp. GC11]